MATKDELTLNKILARIPDENEAYLVVERIRWPNGPVCPHCGVIDHAYFLTPKSGGRKTRAGNVSQRRVYKCAECRKQFSVLKGTIFEDSKIPLRKWLLAFALLCSNKNGTASFELHRTLELDRKTAWFLTMRIRHAMSQEPLKKMVGIIEADESYFGGQAKNMHARQRKEKFTGGPFEAKTPVFALVERGGRVQSQVMPKVTRENVRKALTAGVDSSARLMTDQAKTYTDPGRDFDSHEVNHSDGEYVRGDVYTNTAEGYFSQLKRSIDGTHHHVSEPYLGNYLNEFDFRYSRRQISDAERFEALMSQTQGRLLWFCRTSQSANPYA